MATVWKTKSRARAPSVAETEHLLSESADFYEGCDDVQQVLTAYQTVASHFSRVKQSALDRFLKRFRSATGESDKGISHLDEDGARSKAETSTKKVGYPSNSPHHYPSEAVWVTSASHPSPFSPLSTDDDGHPVTAASRIQVHTSGFLSDLSLQSTPLTSSTASTTSYKADTSPSSSSSHHNKTLTPQELHETVLSALGDTSIPTEKLSGQRKITKKAPTGTFLYNVQEGDTLVKIGARFEVTPSELEKINRLVSRTVFVGQTLFVTDPNYTSMTSPTSSASSIQDTRPKMDIPLTGLSSVPGHAVQVTSTTESVLQSVASKKQHGSPRQSSQVEEEPDKECLQKFLKMPVRRVLDDGQTLSASEGITVKGTLLVTPNAIMFDPNVHDPIVIDNEDQLKFSVVVYMEEIKSVALYHDISPSMFSKQSKKLRGQSPRPETYRSQQGKRPQVEGHAGIQAELDPAATASSVIGTSSRLTPDGASAVVDIGQRRFSPDGGEAHTGRTSEELEHMSEMTTQHITDLNVQLSGRASQEVERALNSSHGYTTTSPVIKQMSHSSELDVCEMSQLQGTTQGIGETRDFGPHMGRSSSEVDRHTSSALGRISDASPGDMTGHSNFTERSDSTSDNLSTPTQGFAPVHFTDRSPMTVTTHPKAVPGQRMMLLSQSPITCTDLKSEQNRIAEDTEVSTSDVSNVTADQSLHGSSDNWSDFSRSRYSSVQVASHFGNNEPSRSHAVTDSSTLSPQSGNKVSTNQEYTTTFKDRSDTHTVGDKLAFQVGDLNLSSTAERIDETDEDSSIPKDDKTQLPFSPLRTPAQHISSFLNYTSSFFRNNNTTTTDEEDSLDTSADGKGRYTSVPSAAPYQLQLKSEFTKEDMSRALGPDPKDYLPKSDSHHFEGSPLYLQIRPGFQKDKEILQPRAFDHRNGDKLYNFLIEWQPDAYGDEEQTKPREKFFYDVRKVEDAAQQLVKTGHGSLTDRVDGDVYLLSDDHFNEAEKTWEILSKEEVYRAEKEQAADREDVFDESNLPELIGPTVIITQEHIRAIMKSLPRNMSVGYNWELVYATHKHGYALQNLYMRTEDADKDSPTLLFIMDTHGSVFGAFLSNTIRPNETFYGSGATFLFTFYPTFKKFSWQGCNQFFMHGTKDFFAVGSGEGHFGLWLDGDLNKGRSHECTTFHNDVLTMEEDFSILQLEVWTFVDSSLL